MTLSQWCGQGDNTVEIATGIVGWSQRLADGTPALVLMRDPRNGLTPQAFLCTDEPTEPEQILAWFMRRWQIEVTFEEARAHLGMETQRQWSDHAIACTMPVILVLYSIVALTARQLSQDNEMPRHAAWYAKDLLRHDCLGVTFAVERSDLQQVGAAERHAENTRALLGRLGKH